VRSLRAVAAVVVKEVRELVRDPITIGVAVLAPLVLLFVFAYAVNLDVHAVPIASADLDQTRESRAYLEQIDRTREFRVVSTTTTPSQARSALDAGRARVAVIVPAGFADRLHRGRETSVQVLIDGSYSATAQVIAAYLDAFNAAFSIEWAPAGTARRVGSLRVDARVWYNPALRSLTSIVPGLFGVILMAFPPLLTALAIVREKEHGSIRQVQISPLPAWAFVVGKLVPYAVLAFVDLVLILAAGRFWFGIPLRGSASVLALASVLYVVATLGIGLFVSSVTRSQVVALLLVLVLTVMPSFLFSGFVFPIFTMPRLLQDYTLLYPGRYFVEIARGIFLKGVGLRVLLAPMGLLAAYAAVMIAIASVRLRVRLE